jgi:phosphosulfolactate phosphohydrolase-like enzyme
MRVCPSPWRGAEAAAFAERHEAAAAAGLFQAAGDRLVEWLRGCVSGRELTERGFGSDVDVAAQLDASRVVPVLTDWMVQRAVVARHRQLADGVRPTCEDGK